MTLVRLLHHFGSDGLDQWVRWRLPTDYGEVYVEVTRELRPGEEPRHFDDLSRFLDMGDGLAE